MKKLFISSLFSLLCVCVATPAMAIKILTVKNNRVLMDTEGATMNVGDKLMARDSNGKAKAIVEIKQVKNDRALAQVLKGAMTNDLTLSPYTGGGGSASKGGTAKRSAGSNKSSAGVLLGYSMNKMTVKPSSTSSIELTGTSFDVSGMYQMTVDGAFGARLLFGYETLVAKGDATAPCTSCEVDISYLGLEALAKYSFIQGSSVDMWVGAGLGFLVAMSKKSNILDESKISTNQTIVGALGLDYHLSPTSFIPIQFDYAVYPDNATSSATQMILRFGYGFAF